ncbi:MAG: hypothetical protein OXH90_07915, partial [Paracoccaceae bacterium]|nr:hypothetical protein [Paracoccaceae bacterium]MDE2917567.1 hypothetical protein [Paracoccaceae bacterium]
KGLLGLLYDKMVPEVQIKYRGLFGWLNDQACQDKKDLIMANSDIPSRWNRGLVNQENQWPDFDLSSQGE